MSSFPTLGQGRPTMPSERTIGPVHRLPMMTGSGHLAVMPEEMSSPKRTEQRRGMATIRDKMGHSSSKV